MRKKLKNTVIIVALSILLVLALITINTSRSITVNVGITLRTIANNIFKNTKDGWASSEVKLIPNVSGLRFEDPDIVRGVEYKYSIQAVDKHGLVSRKTDSSSQLLPKIEPEVKE